MLIHVSFPKDKAEIQKKKMQLMLNKLGGSGGLDPSKGGASSFDEINQKLTQFYKQNKDFDKKQSRCHTTLNTKRSRISSFPWELLRTARRTSRAFFSIGIILVYAVMLLLM